MTTPLLPRVESWIAQDIDESAQRELRDLVARQGSDDAARTELADRFRSRLQFGTAGLRGTMAAGPNRMNRAVVVAAARGLADWLATRVDHPRIVIGNDARYHSREFATDTAAVATAAGAEALLLPDQVPTPVLAYAVRYLHADAGVMVTASHNPAADNGYKVYLGGRIVPDDERGVQIVPPDDAGIAAAIEQAGPANQIPRRPGWTDLGEDVMASYIAAITSGPEDPGPVRIVHTALHGVGSRPALAALRQAGFGDVTSVAAQQAPDPDFPTVGFPNPEEPGTLDLALQVAREIKADVVIANDPDADRCAVGVPDPRGGWRRLHGDELGAVLGEDLASHGLAGVMASSVVSSRQLALIAQEHGVGYVRTLTGFKWLGRIPNLGYAYEEAIGYCVRPDVVRDKDGLSAAIAVARLVARLKAEGRGIVGQLDDLARRHGLYLSSQLAVRFEDVDQIPFVMRTLRTTPPGELGASPVAEVIDLAQGWEDLPPTDGIVLLTRRDDRVVIRPSGTEPKIKCYMDVVQPVAARAGFDDLTEARTAANTRLNRIRADLAAVVMV